MRGEPILAEAVWLQGVERVNPVDGILKLSLPRHQLLRRAQRSAKIEGWRHPTAGLASFHPLQYSHRMGVFLGS